MQMFSRDDIEKALSYPALVDILEAAFRAGAIAPQRHHHTIELEGRPSATLLLMPAWTTAGEDAVTAGSYAGVKIVTVFPDNGPRLGLPAIQGLYVLLSTGSGAPLALLDGPALTAWRTAAASALASRFLSRPDASRLVVVGAGALCPYLIRAHASVRPIREIAIWNRSPEKAERVRDGLPAGLPPVTVAEDLEAAVRQADIVSTATLSTVPLVLGEWLQPGAHVDCVGAFKRNMRETDDGVVRRARIWVDTRAGALAEGGDLVIPIEAGVIGEDKIEGELRDLARGTAPRRGSANDITMFKSVGASIEDLAAAVAVYERPAGRT
ncbi:MAG: ornithine cyclodeaminase family protein [Hyphomicrobiaceae bacterium]